MKKLLIFLFLIISLTAQATNYYIATAANGGSNSNSGILSAPWLTLSYACAHTSSSDIIHVGVGTFTETSQCILPLGVSIEGAGITSIISTTYVSGSNFAIEMYSASEGTNGNQHISNIKMDGNSYTAYGAIAVQCRKNVEIYNCTFINFSHYGVRFNGSYSEPPATTFATGNKFHDNTVTNCGFCTGGAGGTSYYSLFLNGQDGILIYNNTITIARSDDANGVCIGGIEGYNKNMKIHDNTLHKTYVLGTTAWDFAIEHWDYIGGNEIYNNDIWGSVDVGGYANTKGSSTYSVWIHDNTIGRPAITDDENSYGILIEETTEDVIIERNHITNCAIPIYFTQYCSPTEYAAGHTHNVENIFIRYNIIDNVGIGSGGSNKGWGMFWEGTSYNVNTISNIFIDNNVFSGYVGGAPTCWGISMPNIGSASSIYVRNNIIIGFGLAPMWTYQNDTPGASITTAFVQNNIFYGNGNSNAPVYSSLTPSSLTTASSLTSNPLFVSTSDYHLQAGSPAINAGIYAGYTTDYARAVVNNPPERGVYEYGSTGTVPMTAFTLSSAGSATIISTYHGTLQFYTSAITPSNTTDQTFTWSVTNGTGSGTITSGGLLSAVTNGTVTVRAVAHDGSGIYRDLIITLSNQAVSGYPVVITTILADVTPISATLGGNVTLDGGLTVTNRGLCYGASANPTTSNSVIQVGTGTGVFVATITGLTKDTPYHVRAFATNSTGTSYGADIVVTTRAKYIVTY